MTCLTHLFTIYRTLDGLQSETATASDETQTTEEAIECEEVAHSRKNPYLSDESANIFA